MPGTDMPANQNLPIGGSEGREAERLRAALERIADWSDCQCQHDTPDCCAFVADTDFHCPGCIAAVALGVAEPGSQGERAGYDTLVPLPGSAAIEAAAALTGGPSLREALSAARDAMVAFQKQAGWLPQQQAYSCSMTQAEKDLADAVASIDAILQQSAAAALTGGPSRRPYVNVWLVFQNDGGLRGVHASQSRAEAEIAEICRDHPDLARSDFVVQVERIRGEAGGPSPQATGWQPIETAPETHGNGRHVLLYVPRYGLRSLIVEGWVNQAHPGSPWVAENGGQIEPTHWMPLPDPPTSDPVTS